MSSIALQFTGTYAECDAFVAKQLRAYPTPGYSTWFNWPPNSKFTPKDEPVKYLECSDYGSDRYTVRGERMDSCD